MDVNTIAIIAGGVPPLSILELWGMENFDDHVFWGKAGGGVAFLVSSTSALSELYLRRGDVKAMKIARLPYPYPIAEWCEAMAQHHPALGSLYSSVLAHHRSAPPLVTVVTLFYDNAEKARHAAQLLSELPGLELIPPDKLFDYLAALVPPQEDGVAPPIPSTGGVWPDLLARMLAVFGGES